MNRRVKGLGVLAALLPLVGVSTAEAATPAGPTTVLAGQPLPSPAAVEIVDPINGWVQQLTGYPPPQPEFLCASPNTCANLIYPFFSIPEGVTALNSVISTSSGPLIVFTYSQGGQVAEQWLKQHANDLTAPSASNLVFVVTGNSTRAYGGSMVEAALGRFSPTAEVWPQSQYQVIDVARQYEYSADYPNNLSSPFYLLAIANTLAGGYYLHDYSSVDSASAINDSANTVWKVGNITYVLIPTQDLPLLDPLRQMGLNALADQLQPVLKPLIDSAYNRNYPGIIQPGIITTQPAAAIGGGITAPAATLSSSMVSDPAVAPQKISPSVTLGAAPSDPAQSGPASAGTDNASFNPIAKPVTAIATATGSSEPVGVPATADPRITTTSADPVDVVDTAISIPPGNSRPGLSNPTASKGSRTALQTHSSANANRAMPGQRGAMPTTTNTARQDTATEDGKKAAHTSG